MKYALNTDLPYKSGINHLVWNGEWMKKYIKFCNLKILQYNLKDCGSAVSAVCSGFCNIVLWIQ